MGRWMLYTPWACVQVRNTELGNPLSVYSKGLARLLFVLERDSISSNSPGSRAPGPASSPHPAGTHRMLGSMAGGLAPRGRACTEADSQGAGPDLTLARIYSGMAWAPFAIWWLFTSIHRSLQTYESVQPAVRALAGNGWYIYGIHWKGFQAVTNYRWRLGQGHQ